MAQKRDHVFISYAQSDKDLVQKVAQELRDEGLNIWDPDERILPGANWRMELNKALESAVALVVFISPEAIASRSVSHEIEYALGARHLRGRLIPVMIRPTKDAPWILDSLHSVRYQSPAKTGRRGTKDAHCSTARKPAEITCSTTSFVSRTVRPTTHPTTKNCS